MQREFFIPLFNVRDFLDCPIYLISLLLSTTVKLFLLLRRQRVVDFPGNLEFKVNGNVRGGTRCIGRVGGRVVLIRRHVGKFLLFPPSDDGFPESRIPGIGTISLDRGKFSLVALTKP